MAERPDMPSIDPKQVGKGDADLTGRERMTWNVLTSWAGQIVFIIAGFIMPRMVDQHLGQQALGVWDFAWSLVAYFRLVQGGIVSSVNRYVAKYRVVGDEEGVNCAVSSVSCVLLVMGTVITGLTIVAALQVPNLLSDQVGEYVNDAKWVILFLGLSIAVQITFAGFGGVVTGCHRWDLHNAIYAGTHVLTVAAMITALVLGAGLPALGFVTLCGELIGRLVRCVVAYRVYPPLSVRLAHARWSTARSMLGFGGKSYLPRIGELLLNQTTSVLIIAYMGPSALALYARPRALVRHVRTIVQKFAMVLTPTASSFHATNKREELRTLLVTTTRYAAYISLPLVLLLAILGNPILHIWMGENYVLGLVPAILAGGHLSLLIQRPVLAILTGMNMHGRPGLINFCASAIGAALTAVALGPLDLGLVGAALAVTVPLTIANAIYVPIYACQLLDVPIRRYLVDSMRGPVLCAMAFSAPLVVAHIAFAGRPIAMLGCGMGIGGPILAGLYWRYVLPPSYKRKLSQRLKLMTLGRSAEPR